MGRIGDDEPRDRDVPFSDESLSLGARREAAFGERAIETDAHTQGTGNWSTHEPRLLTKSAKTAMATKRIIQE